MDLVINVNKSVEQNAEVYYEKAKKFKKKIPGIKEIIESTKDKISKLDAESTEADIKKSVVKRDKEWYEKFRWFISSDGFLVIGGRDATSNDIIVKKHLDRNDIVFHTELPGSPFVIVKNPENKKIPENTIKEASELCASYSKSWKAERTTAEVYWITPEQVSKQAPTGTAALAKGSFMIYGKRNFLTPIMSVAICNRDGAIMAGPLSAIKKQSDKYVEIIQGKEKLSDVAKKVRKIIGGDLDEIVRALPPDSAMKRQK